MNKVIFSCALVSSALMIQGCSSTKPRGGFEPPPTPVMPPKAGVEAPVAMPVFQPATMTVTEPKVVAPAPTTTAKTYVVQSGDSLSRIAQRHGVSLRELKECNKITDPNKIRVGQKLALPTTALSVPVKRTSTGAVSAPKKTAAGAAGGYLVKSGDTLGGIAKAHGVKVADIKTANGLKSDMIRAGQTLVMPDGKKVAEPVKKVDPVKKAEQPAKKEKASEPKPMVSAPEPAAPLQVVIPEESPKVEVTPPAAMVVPAVQTVSQVQPLEYTVIEGDTLDSLARLYYVSKEDIIKLNGMTMEEPLKPGSRIKIPMMK